MHRLRLLAAVAALAGCDQGGKPAALPPPPATPDALTVAPPAPPASAAAEAPAPPPVAYHGGPGPAYLGIDGAGVYRLEDGKLTRLVKDAYRIYDLAVAPDGAVFAAGIGGLWKLGGPAPQRLDDDRTRSIERIAVGPDGVLWGTDRRGVFRWDGAWTAEPADTFGGASDLIGDLAVDRDGRVWVLQANALWRLDGDHWSKLDIGFAGSQPFLEAVAMHPDGSVYLAGMEGVFAFRDGRWRKTNLAARYGTVDELAIGPAGHVATSGGVGSLAVQAPGGAVRATELEDGPARAHRGDVLAIDGAGRTWITTDNGLVILDRDGALAQQWLPGTVAGVTGKIDAAVVVGDGPTLPPLTAAATGAITGKVLRAGKPVGGAAVELCDQPLTMFRKTPCESSTTSFAATTAADGTFRLADVPVGTYGFAVKPGPQWIILIGGDCCAALEAGGSYDVGAITLD